VKLLSLVSLQMGGVVRSSQLPDLSPNLDSPKPKIKVCNGESRQECLTLSAGLPHFTTGYTRNWGRDTFIALRGLFLLTGRYDEARFIILGFAGTLRHGLIPNLLDKGSNARCARIKHFYKIIYSRTSSMIRIARKMKNASSYNSFALQKFEL